MTKQRRYIKRLADRIMELIERKRINAFDKHCIAKTMGFKDTTNTSEALGALYRQGRILRVVAGCKNAQGLESAPALYVRK